MARKQEEICQGYDYEFVDNVPDEYICKICHLPIRKPVQTKCCGNRFCKDCLQEANKRKRRPECPMDRKTLDIPQDVFDDKGAERTVNSFRIKCQCQGCNWQGELGNVESHFQKCDYKVIKCSNEQCVVMKLRMEMTNHLQDCQWRGVSCPHCKKTKHYCELEAHEQTCDYKVIKCSNEQCDVMKPRMEMTNHLTNECRWREVQCPHCGSSREFYKLQDHTKVCPRLPVKCSNDCGKQTTNEKIADHIDNECPLTKIPCTYQSFGCKFMVQRKYHLMLVNHMENNMKDHLALTTKSLSSLQNKYEKLEKTLAAVKEQAIPCTNNFVWKINNIKEKLEDAKSGTVTRLYSDPFYTEKYGYKLRVQLGPNGNTAENAGHISVFFQLLRGEYDALLPWPFPKDVTFTLVDQKEILTNRKNVTKTASFKALLASLLNNIQKPTSDSNPCAGFFKFISHETLMGENYIVDNSIFILVDVTDPPA